MFLRVSGRYVGALQMDTCSVSMHTQLIRFEGKRFAYLSTYISQILDFKYWMAFIFIFDSVIVSPMALVRRILDASKYKANG